jgi:NADH-quinone oxidoreductase subunit M
MNMDTWNPIILTLVTFVPLAGALLLVVLPRRDREIRGFALFISLVDFFLSLHLPAHFHRNLAGFQYEIDKVWINHPNIHYHLGMDGISMWLVVLTTFLTPLCVLISWHSINERVKEFFILLLDSGDGDDRRVRRARSVCLLLLLGSHADSDGASHRHVWPRTQGLCCGKVLPLHDDRIGVHARGDSLALRPRGTALTFVTIQNAIRSGQVAGFSSASLWLFLGFFVAFAVKVPLFPFHTWLPDAHVEAPTAGSVLTGRRSP